ncbi:cell adhesion molecule 3 isoform X1 [Cherax quadricarinatus]|uniref:cell adhesion molecule 3 isoform X1 n=1 Tax=Cherax quadricarinatus TaxID=27406 RepID=UPI00387EA4C8
MGFYSVRWYKNGEQFYSFVPKNTPQVKVDHHLRGVTVELTQSDEHRVTLRELRLDSDGVYRCEVMSEAPTFQTSFASSNMTVVVMPEAPVLKGLRGVYRVGDILNVTCTARDAFPHATLTFHVNGRLVHPGSGRVQELPTTEGTYPGVYSSTSRLVLPLSEHHAPTLSLVCYAHVLSLSVPIEASIKVEPPRTPILSFFNAAGSGPGAPYLASLLLGICLTHRLLLPCLLLSCTSTS